MEKYDINGIAELLPFSDNEISLLQFSVHDYIVQENDRLTNKRSFILGILSTNIQYNFRILKERIEGGVGSDPENDKFFEVLSSFEGIFDFMRNKLLDDWGKFDGVKKYEYLNGTYYSFFNASDEVKEKTIKDGIKILKNIWLY